MKAHKRKVNMKVLCREQSENRRENIFRASLRKLFYCDVYHVSICAQHAENPLKCVHDDRRFRKRRRENGKLFLPFPLHYILWNIHEIHVPRFTMECAAIPKTEKNVKSSLRVYFICQSCCSVEGEHILSSHRSTSI